MNLTQFIHDLPKAEIHIHLEGAIQPETVLKLAERHKMLGKLPGDNVDELKKWFTFSDFSHFIVVYLTIQDLLRTPEDFALIAYENGADMAAQNIRYRELTVTPYTHTDFQNKLPIEAVLEGLADGRSRAKRDFNVEMRWVFDVPRNLSFPQRDGQTYDPRPAEKTLAYALQGRDFGVVGFGLGGNEVNAPPEPFAHAFASAKAEGPYGAHCAICKPTASVTACGPSKTPICSTYCANGKSRWKSIQPAIPASTFIQTWPPTLPANWTNWACSSPSTATTHLCLTPISCKNTPL